MAPGDKKRAREAAERARAETAGRRSDEGWHWRAVLRRQLRHRAGDLLAIALVVILGLATTLVILNEQDRALPGWVPVLGQDFFEFEAEFSTGHAIMPGQGQAVVMSGVQVGKISSVELEDGKAVIGMDLEPEYGEIVRSDASLLVRPKTGLNDMVIELDPGAAPEYLEESARVPLARTKPTVQPDQIFAMLDGDTRAYLKLLVNAGSQGLKDGAEKLSAGLRRFEPFARFIARFNGALAKRREALSHVIHDFQRLTTELARSDDEITRFVDSSADALAGFANQSTAIRESLRELPSALSTTRSALGKSTELSTELRPTLTRLIPQAQALAPGLRSLQSFFDDTLEPVRDQIRPFTREVRPVVRHAKQTANPLEKTVGNFGSALGALNYGFNELAFNPGPDAPGYLFYLPWLNHNMNSTYSLQDGNGPFRRSIVLMSCAAAHLAEGFVLTQEFLGTVYHSLDLPVGDQICPGT